MTTKQSRALKIAIAQAFSIVKWGVKLESLPSDMVDGCYDFADMVMMC